MNSDLYEQLLMYCRSGIAIALLGQNQSRSAATTQAPAGLEVARRPRWRAALACAINQLLRWMTDLHDGEQAPADL